MRINKDLDDVNKILSYFKEHNIPVFLSGKQVAALYRYFSKTMYSAKWLIVNEDSLKHFTDWLNDQNTIRLVRNSYRINNGLWHMSSISFGCFLGLLIGLLKLESMSRTK